MGRQGTKLAADTLSKSLDFDKWEKFDAFYQYLSDIWSLYSVNRFADNFNKKVPIFKSKYWCPNTSLVNALRVSWENENNSSAC